MFDIAWSELLVVAVLILIVVGPKDLPGIMRSIGGLVRKARGFARQFSAGMNQLAREADLDGLQKKAQAIKNFKAGAAAKAALDPDNRIEAGFPTNSIMGDDNQAAPTTAVPENTPKRESKEPPKERRQGADSQKVEDSGEGEA
jgi:sec-independent protein translocase protein TatB